MTRRLTSLLLLPLLLGGCLLPQPDTPPIGRTPASRPAAGPVGPGTPLLPQPDTPPVGAAPAKGNEGAVSTTVAPQAGGTSDANAVTAPNMGAGVATNTGAAIAPTAAASAVPAPSATPVANGKLQGKITGATVTAIAVSDEAGTTTFQSAPVGSDGSFGFTLAPGRYVLVLTTDKGETLKPSQVFTVGAGESRTYSIELKDHTDAVVSETAPLASPSPSAKP
jgi:hypothetical protein